MEFLKFIVWDSGYGITSEKLAAIENILNS